MSPETMSLITKIFKVHLNNEVLFNQIRLYISTTEISIPGIFNTLCNNKKYVDQNDFDVALKANGSTCPTQYHDLIFQRFDLKKEGVFDLTFFTNGLRIWDDFLNNFYYYFSKHNKKIANACNSFSLEICGLCFMSRYTISLNLFGIYKDNCAVFSFKIKNKAT